MRTIATMTDAERAEEWLRAAQHELGRGNLGPALRALASADMLDALETARRYMADCGCQDREGFPHMQDVCAAIRRAKGEG